MARNNSIINSFVTGEASPKFRGRTDTSQYAQSCEETLNMLIYPQGGAGRRPGTQLMQEILENNTNYPEQVRIFPFSAADGSRYQIVMTDLLPGVLDAGNGRYTWYAINIDTLAMSQIGYVSGQVVPYTYYNFKTLNGGSDLDLTEIQYAQTGDTMYFVHPMFRPFRLIFGGGIFIMKAVAGTFTAITPNVYKEMPFQDLVQNSTATIKVTGTTAPVEGSTYTLEPGAAFSYVFSADMVGRHFRFSAAGVTLVVVITAFTSSVLVTATFVGGDITASPTTFGSVAGTSWELGYWDAILGWPRTVSFFESRIVFGGNKGFPDTMWFSRINDIYNIEVRRLEQDPDFALAVAADDPFYITLKAEILNQIRWMSPGKSITVGTNQREFVVQGISQNGSIGPSNYQTQAETSQGSAYAMATRIQNTTVFIERDRRKIRELVYNLDENSFQAIDLNVIAEHIAQKSSLKFADPTYTSRDSAFVMLAFQSVPDGILWCLDSNGVLCGLTRERQQQVLAWHYHEIAGVSLLAGAQYSPKITSISTIQTPESSSDKREPDELWMTVARSINAGSSTYSKKFFVERFAREWQQPTIEDGWDDFIPLAGSTSAPIYMDMAMLVDSGDLPAAGEDTGIIPAIPHGVGQSLSVVINGFYVGEATVSESSEINIFSIAEQFMGSPWKAIIGFNYNADLIPAVQEVPATTGSSMGQPRRVDQLVAHFNRTIACQYGRPVSTEEEDTPEYDMEDFDFGIPSDNGATPIQMFTGDKKVVFAKGFSDRPRVMIRSNKPLPMQITHLVLKQVVYE